MSGPTPPPTTPSRSLFVSNLSQSTTEYHLVSLFTPHGKLSRLDLIFHKSGPLKGKTKGYAFVEYARLEDAIEAKVKVDGRALNGRKIVVGWASKDTKPDLGPGPNRSHTYSRSHADEAKPTTLSLLKNSQKVRGGTNAKIAAMEAKLAALKERGSGREGEGETEPAPSPSPSTSSSSLRAPPANANLPKKPTTTTRP